MTLSHTHQRFLRHIYFLENVNSNMDFFSFMIFLTAIDTSLELIVFALKHLSNGVTPCLKIVDVRVCCVNGIRFVC